jgi:hypothetical protein
VTEPRTDKPIRRWLRRNLWWLAPLTAIIVLAGGAVVLTTRGPATTSTITAMCANGMPPATSGAASYDRYPAWPPTGTNPSMEGEEPFCANAIVALSCTDDLWRLYPKSLVGGAAPTERIKFDWYDISPNLCSVKWPAQDQTKVQIIVLEYTDGAPIDGKPAWTMLQTVYSADGTQSMKVRSGTNDIAVALINFADQKPGFRVPYGPNGIQAPPKGFMS